MTTTSGTPDTARHEARSIAPIDPRTTLGALVTERPHLATSLERLGLDYCCGGDRPLADAAHAAGLDPHAVLEELSGQAGPSERPTWADLGPAALVDHIERTHHAYLRDALPRLDALAEKVADVHGERHPELAEIRRLVGEFRAELDPHLAKEEQVLFPMIRELAAARTAPSFHCGTLRDPISVMLREHDRAGELLAEMRTATSEHTTPDDGCASYRALFDGLAGLESDTHLHVHIENNVLFPAVLELEQRLGSA